MPVLAYAARLLVRVSAERRLPVNAGLSSPHIGRNASASVSTPEPQSYNDWLSEQIWIADRSPRLSFRPLTERPTWGVSYAKGGNLVKLIMPRSKAPHIGGGTRGQITEFTSA